EEINEKVRDYVAKLPDDERKKITQDITVILNLGADQRTNQQKQTFANFFKSKDPEFKKRFDQIAKLRKEEPKFPTTMVLQELPKPRETYVHLGGDFTRKGPTVGAGVPSVLHPLHAHGQRSVGANGANRLDFARWLVDTQNPLLGRVTMNRLWMRYFG